MRRNDHGTNDIARSNFDMNTVILKVVKMLLAEVKEIKANFMKFSFQSQMDTVDISIYFPLKDEEALEDFLKFDEEWHQRRKAFYELLYNTVTNEKKRFACALLHVVFTREFIRDHKWPMAGGYFYEFNLISNFFFLYSTLFFKVLPGKDLTTKEHW